MIKVVLADDHQSFIEGIESILKNHKEEIKVIRTVNHGMGVIDILKEHRVDVVVLDISMPGMEKEDWIAARAILESYPKVKLLILTMHLNGKYIKELIDLGIQGYIVKNRSTREVVEAIKKINSGKQYFSEGVSDAFLEENYKTDQIAKLHITPREKEILLVLTQDASPAKLMGDKMNITEGTINVHKRNLRKKLGVKSDKELMKYAHDHLKDELGLK